MPLIPPSRDPVADLFNKSPTPPNVQYDYGTIAPPKLSEINSPATPTPNSQPSNGFLPNGNGNPELHAAPVPITSDIYQMINDAVKPNPLNPYYQVTYHFRLFVAADGDIVATKGVTAPTQLSAAIASVDQFTLAESGVTGYNIKEVTFRTIDGGNDTTRQVSATSFKITISEPNGISFLDTFGQAQSLLKLRNQTKATYYLELYFQGYDQKTGRAVAPITDGMSQGGRWVWALSISRVTTKLNEAGAVYSIDAVGINSSILSDGADLLSTSETITVKGNKLGDLLNDYVTQLNASWKKRYNGTFVVFEPIVLYPVKSSFPNPSNALTAKDPASFSMLPTEPDKEPDRHLDFKSIDGVYTASMPTGYKVTEFIIDAIKHTIEGQKLAVDDNGAASQPDQSATATNDRKYRESITWNVEPVVEVKDYDKVNGQYIRHITFHVTPRYTTGKPISRPEVDNAKLYASQSGKMKSLIANGMFRKRYDYVFTGMNTEVINFDLGWNMNFSAVLAASAGINYKYDAFRVNRRISNSDKSGDGNSSQRLPSEAPQSVGLAAPRSSSSSTGVTAANAATTGQASSLSEVKKPPTNSYIEDYLQQVVDSNEFAAPISFMEGYKEIQDETGLTNFVGQQSRYVSVAGSVWQQGESDAVTSTYQHATMTIRGDPFWLGQTNLARQVSLSQKNISVPKADAPAGDNNQRIFLYFRYPLMKAGDFRPAMKTSQTFNGVYGITYVDHTFADGEFRQELHMQKEALIDPQFWTNNPNPSSATDTSSGPKSNGHSTATSNGVTAPGASPQPGVDYTPGDPTSFTKAFLPLAQAQSAQTGVAPETILGQAALETGWGKSAPGNNFFGIKGQGGTYMTTEVINGVSQQLPQNFAGYQTSADSFAGYGQLMQSSRYSGVASAGGYADQIKAIKNAGYATDPDYVAKVTSTANRVHGIIGGLATT